MRRSNIRLTRAFSCAHMHTTRCTPCTARSLTMTQACHSHRNAVRTLRPRSAAAHPSHELRPHPASRRARLCPHIHALKGAHREQPVQLAGWSAPMRAFRGRPPLEPLGQRIGAITGAPSQERLHRSAFTGAPGTGVSEPSQKRLSLHRSAFTGASHARRSSTIHLASRRS